MHSPKAAPPPTSPNASSTSPTRPTGSKKTSPPPSPIPTEDHRHLADGYTAITLLAASRDLPAATTQFNAAVTSLKQMNTEDSNFFADQLLSIHRFFLKYSPIFPSPLPLKFQI